MAKNKGKSQKAKNKDEVPQESPETPKENESISVGALGEDLITNKPVVDIIDPAAPGPELPPEPPETPQPKPKEKPKHWPFNKSNIINERREMEHIARLINMKYDNPDIRKITKIVTYDCQSREIVCKDYKIEY